MNLDNEFSELQRLFAQNDSLTDKRPHSKNGFMELLLIKRKNIKFKIYQEKGHQLPHIHIDYGKQNHVASYDVASSERLEGNLPKKYDRDVLSWLERNRGKVLKIWSVLQAGESHNNLVAELTGDL